MVAGALRSSQSVEAVNNYILPLPISPDHVLRGLARAAIAAYWIG